MEVREITGIVVSCYTDSVFNISYLKVLTGTSVESVKLSSSIDQSKFRHAISPNNLLTMEIIKTRKNWILQHILQSSSIASSLSYHQILRLSEIMKTVSESIIEDQEIRILPWLIYIIREKIHCLDVHEFRQTLHEKLNFKEENLNLTPYEYLETLQT